LPIVPSAGLDLPEDRADVLAHAVVAHEASERAFARVDPAGDRRGST
jgi:hypothetical protein